MTCRMIKCRKCHKNSWKASQETDEDMSMLYLMCKCGHIWTALLE